MSITFTGVDFSAPITHVGLYSDNTPMVKTPDYQDIVNKADTVIIRADSLQEFMVGMFMVDSVMNQGGEINRLVLPYLPGARQDRVNVTGDVLFMAESIAHEINMRYFDEVIAVDPHSGIMPRLIDSFVEYPLERVYDRLWKGYGGVIAPDKGATVRAETAARVMWANVTYASKVRDVSTGALTGFSVDVEPGRHYIVIDDICDGGGTFIGLGEKIREQGAYADLFVTHGIFAKGTKELKKFYKNIYTTDSLPQDSENGVNVFSVVESMTSL